jgi:aspartyl/asparaginyl beta-hydroxylase (cupin superfamily)
MPWHDGRDYAFTSVLEGAFTDIRRELFAALEVRQGFQPYRQERDFFVPHGYWKALFIKVGESWMEENRELCPVTYDIMASVPRLAEIAMFSALNPDGHIKPHCGGWNCRLTFHLGISIPKDCSMRVGSETRTWQEGKCTVFDDSYEHEVWNRSEFTRFILLFDIWHPDLTPVEVELFEGMREMGYLLDASEMRNSVKSGSKDDLGKTWWT